MDIKNHYTEMTADKVNIDKCICDLDLAASKRHDCEAIRKHIREIRRIFAGIPEEPAQRTQSVVDAAMRDIEEKSKAFTAAHQEEASEEILSEMRGEEPVSEELEEEINEYISILTERNGNFPKLTRLGFRTIARHFSNWQKEQMLKDGVETSVKTDAGGYPYIPTIELYDYNESKPLAKEGDKVKVIIIK